MQDIVHSGTLCLLSLIDCGVAVATLGLWLTELSSINSRIQTEIGIFATLSVYYNNSNIIVTYTYMHTHANNYTVITIYHCEWHTCNDIHTHMYILR